MSGEQAKSQSSSAALLQRESIALARKRAQKCRSAEVRPNWRRIRPFAARVHLCATVIEAATVTAKGSPKGSPPETVPKGETLVPPVSKESWPGAKELPPLRAAEAALEAATLHADTPATDANTGRPDLARLPFASWPKEGQTAHARRRCIDLQA